VPHHYGPGLTHPPQVETHLTGAPLLTRKVARCLIVFLLSYSTAYMETLTISHVGSSMRACLLACAGACECVCKGACEFVCARARACVCVCVQKVHARGSMHVCMRTCAFMHKGHMRVGEGVCPQLHSPAEVPNLFAITPGTPNSTHTLRPQFPYYTFVDRSKMYRCGISRLLCTSACTCHNHARTCSHA
jgi:hypothetical protein